MLQKKEVLAACYNSNAKSKAQRKLGQLYEIYGSDTAHQDRKEEGKKFGPTANDIAETETEAYFRVVTGIPRT
jgi:hypothetical protein